MNTTTTTNNYQLYYHNEQSNTTKQPSYEYNPDKCSICLMDFEKGQQISKLNCNHIYHMDCVNNFINHGGNHIQKKCALCRIPIIKSTIINSNYGTKPLIKPSYLMEIQKPDYEIKTTEIKGCFDIFDNLPKIIQDIILKQLINPIFICEGKNTYEIDKIHSIIDYYLQHFELHRPRIRELDFDNTSKNY